MQQSCRVRQGSPGPQEGRRKDSDVQRGGNDQAQEGWKVEVSLLSLANIGEAGSRLEIRL